jgi:hypothetical protein
VFGTKAVSTKSLGTMCVYVSEDKAGRTFVTGSKRQKKARRNSIRRTLFHRLVESGVDQNWSTQNGRIYLGVKQSQGK